MIIRADEVYRLSGSRPLKEHSLEAPARPHRRLIWKYTAVVVTLVGAAIVSVGLTELYFSYQDGKRALTRFERNKASTAATVIEQEVQAILRQLEGVAQPTDARGRAGLTERKQNLHRLLEREELVSQLSYLDSNGKEQVRTNPLRSIGSAAGPISLETPCSPARVRTSGI